MARLDPKTLTRSRSQPSTGHEVRYNCPYCGDMKGRLWCNFKKGLWTCFHCGESGTILPRDIQAVQGEDVQFRGENPRQFDWRTYPDIRGSGKLYLRERNIPVDVAWAWGVRSGKGDSVGRLVIPVKYRTRRGIRTVFRVAHATTDATFPKELQSGDRKPWILTWTDDGEPTFPDVDTKLPLHTAVVVEGAADALRMASATLQDSKLTRFMSVVCLWGKHLSEDAAFTLARMFDNFYVLLDREDGLSKHGEKVAGMKIQSKLAAISGGQVSRHMWGNKRAYDGHANDPAELDDEGAVKLLHHALRATGG